MIVAVNDTALEYYFCPGPDVPLSSGTSDNGNTEVPGSRSLSAEVVMSDPPVGGWEPRPATTPSISSVDTVSASTAEARPRHAGNDVRELDIDLRFAVLGEVRGWRDQQALDLGPLQARVILAVLLLHNGRPVEIDDLIEAVWGVQAPTTAVNAVRTQIARLRRTLEPERSVRETPRVLVSIGRAYALRLPKGALDAAEALDRIARADSLRRTGDLTAARRTLNAALELWHGPELTGLTGPYAARQRSRLSEIRITALERRLEMDLDLGEPDDTIAELVTLIDEYPLRERLRALLMVALSRSGRQAEALAVYTDIRTMLVEELGVEPSAELITLHTQILQAAPGVTSRSDGSATATATATAYSAQSARAVVPAQLPADLADFTGRAQLINDVIDLLGASSLDTVAIVSLNGMGGIGKSSLAVHIAHLVRDQYPDGQLHVDLHGADDDPAKPEVTLGGFLRALGVAEADLPTSMDDRSALLRSLLAGRRVLMVLDNARDCEHVRSLIPGTRGTAVLITSRTALNEFPGATPIRMPPLDQTEALNLLARIIGEQRVDREPEAAADAVAACGYLPLAIRVLGARLASRPQWDIAHLTGRLANEDERLEILKTGHLAVEAVLRLGYDRLDLRQAKAFRLLARTGVPVIPVDGAAAVLNCSVAQAEELCESLVDLNLLDTLKPGRYRYHDLLRLFARQLPDSSEDVALPAMLDYYLATVKNLHTVGHPGTRLPEYLLPTTSRGMPVHDVHARQSWLDIERPNLIALFHEATVAGGAILRVAADVAWALAEMIDTGTLARDMIQALGSLLQAATASEDSAIEARVRAALGTIQTLCLARPSDAAPHLERASLLAAGLGDRRLYAWSEVMRVAGIAGSEITGTLRTRFEAEIALCREVQDPWVECLCLLAMAKAFTVAGLYDESETTGRQTLDLARQIENSELQCFAFQELSILASGRGEHDHALELATEALRLARAIGLRLPQGWSLARLALVALKAGRFEQAETVSDEAIQVLTDAANIYLLGPAMLIRGHALAAMNRLEDAQHSYANAHRLFCRLERSTNVETTQQLLDNNIDAPADCPPEEVDGPCPWSS